MKKNSYIIILFYKFTNIKNPEAFKLKQRKIAESFGLKGRMLIIIHSLKVHGENQEALIIK